MSRPYNKRPAKQQQQQFIYVTKEQAEEEEQTQQPQQKKKEYPKQQQQQQQQQQSKQSQNRNQNQNQNQQRFQKQRDNDYSRETEEVIHFDIAKFQHKELTQVLTKMFKTKNIECPICYDRIFQQAKIWSCTQCFQPFHLQCTHKWIKNLNPLNKNLFHNWSCPKCNMLYQDKLPEYKCFCGKVSDPDPDSYQIPHSCSQKCQKQRGTHCPHPCPMDCHPGPCPECHVQGIEAQCFCGKSSKQMQCSELKKNFACQQVCNKKLDCGEHFCQKQCHPGSCGSCTILKTIQCYCKSSIKEVNCAIKEYSCEYPCKKILDCGRHQCLDICHPKCNPCHLTPELVTHCQCGKYKLTEMMKEPRKSCMDHIPNCGSPIETILPCGHKSRTICGSPYPPCTQKIKQKCFCGDSEEVILCKDKGNRKCEKVCKKRKSCGVHYCNSVCCPPTAQQDGLHLCMKICGKPLACGNHTCELFCHIGTCQPCPITVVVPITCPCGKTVKNPPQKCGTKPPGCLEICGKQLGCGHNCQTLCHSGACPLCLESVEKLCRCQSSKIMVICSKISVCRKSCGKELKCGHKCPDMCPLPGECPLNQEPNCGQKCNKKKICGHFCQEICHPNLDCPKLPCKTQVRVICGCGNRDTFFECGVVDEVTDKELKCDLRCQNIKRFGAFYKSNQLVDIEKTYYPDILLKYAHYNIQSLQKLEEKVEYFLVNSSPNEGYDFSFPRSDYFELKKLALQTLFSRHYRFDVQILRSINKQYLFSLFKTQLTTIPKIKLSEYYQKVQKGIIKRDHQPFKVKIRCNYDFCNSEMASIENALSDLKNDFYSEHQGTSWVFNFWEENQADQALKKLKRIVGMLSINWIVELNYQALEEDKRFMESLNDNDIIIKPKSLSILSNQKQNPKIKAQQEYEENNLEVSYSEEDLEQFKIIDQQFEGKAKLCQMCDEEEKQERVDQKQLSIFEQDPFYQYEIIPKREWMIRRYHRVQKEFVPEYVRTPSTLIKVVDFLLTNFLNVRECNENFKRPMQKEKIRDLTYDDLWEYVNDRLMQVRIEMSHLEFKDDDTLAKMIRFHIISHSQLEDNKENLKHLCILIKDQFNEECIQYKLILSCFDDQGNLNQLLNSINELKLGDNENIKPIIELAISVNAGCQFKYLDFYTKTQNQLFKSLMHTQLLKVREILFTKFQQAAIQMDVQSLKEVLQLSTNEELVQLLSLFEININLEDIANNNINFKEIINNSQKIEKQGLNKFQPFPIDMSLIFQ